MQGDAQAAAKAKFHSRIRDGIGQEVRFASTGDQPGAVRASVESLDNFIFRRSGIRLSGTVKNRLAEMESRSLNGQSHRISVNDLDDALTATAFERLSALSDDEILHIDDSLRGFKSPDLPKSYGRRDLILPGRVVSISTDRFVSQVKAMRDQITTSLADMIRTSMRQAVARIVHDRVSAMTEALPDAFAGAWDPAGNHPGPIGLTPVEGMVIAYSVASQDLLCDSGPNLDKLMKAMQNARTETTKQPYPGPEEHFAYGVNGYITSSPLDLAFNERTLNRLLDQIDERSSK
ncbi:MAG TPA: hypothetical protein VF397_15590 [Pyrinomonadaceae bacterium]